MRVRARKSSALPIGGVTLIVTVVLVRDTSPQHWVERYSITSRYDFPALKAALLKDASSNWTLWAKTRSASIAAIALSTNFSEGAFISRVPLLLRPRRASFSLEQSPRACARSRLR